MMLEAVPEDSSPHAARVLSNVSPYRIRSTASNAPSSNRMQMRSGRASLAGSIPRITVHDWAESVANLMLTEQGAVQSPDFARFVQTTDATGFASAAYFYLLIWKKIQTLRSPAPVTNSHRVVRSLPPKPWDEIWQENPKLRTELQESLQQLGKRYALLLLRYSRPDAIQDRDFFDCVFDFTIRTMKVGFSADPELFPAMHQELRRVLYSKSFMGKTGSETDNVHCIRERRRIRECLKVRSPLIDSVLLSASTTNRTDRTTSFIL